jgi:hypothetical protein
MLSITLYWYTIDTDIFVRRIQNLEESRAIPGPQGLPGTFNSNI